MLAGRRVLVTGGSGTIGSRMVERLLEHGVDVVRVLGRDETKQFYQQQRHAGRRDLRFLIGDIRDRERVSRAMEGIDLVFHCAALKHVGSGEYNPFEATQTNIIGTQNVIDACLEHDVRTMVFTSSDKAANPTSVMGATKLVAEKLVTAATNYRGAHATTFASVRFGNVLGSRGSALELFASQVAAGGPVTMTDPAMATSAEYRGAPVPSTIVPPNRTRSTVGAVPGECCVDFDVDVVVMSDASPVRSRC